MLRAGWYAWGLALDGLTSYAIAPLRLDGMRGQLDDVIAGWQSRVAAGGRLVSLDPGRLSLIRQFTARHVAADGAQRVIELAALIGTVPATRA